MEMIPMQKPPSKIQKDKNKNLGRTLSLGVRGEQTKSPADWLDFHTNKDNKDQLITLAFKSGNMMPLL